MSTRSLIVDIGQLITRIRREHSTSSPARFRSTTVHSERAWYIVACHVRLSFSLKELARSHRYNFVERLPSKASLSYNRLTEREGNSEHCQSEFVCKPGRHWKRHSKCPRTSNASWQQEIRWSEHISHTPAVDLVHIRPPMLDDLSSAGVTPKMRAFSNK